MGALAIAAALAAAWLAYGAAKVAYRLLLHPLAHVPGPRLAAATFWYEAWHDVARDGQYVFKLGELHDRYGDVVRCSPDEVHVRRSDFFDVLHPGPSGGRRHKWERSNRANGSPGSVASAIHHDLHRLRRSALNPYFSKAAVAQLASHSIASKVGYLCERLEREYAAPAGVSDSSSRQHDDGDGDGDKDGGAGTPVDLNTAMCALTLDVITEYCYDDCFDCLRQPAFAPHWGRVMADLFEPTSVAKHFPVVMRLMASLPRSLAVRMNPDMDAFLGAQEAMSAQARAIYREHHQGEDHSAPLAVGDGGRTLLKKDGGPGVSTSSSRNTSRPKTVFHGMLQADLPPAEKQIDRLADEAFVLLVAGAETTARVAMTILCHLAENPDVAARLRRELRDAGVSSFSSSSSSSSSSASPLLPLPALEKIPLLKAVISEGVRLAEPVTNRQILIAPDEDLSCAGVPIPRGTPMSQTFRDVLLDPALFPDPRRFDPGRWLPLAAAGEDQKQQQQQQQRLDRYLVSFSRGQRACLGLNLAYAELYLVTAALVSRFDMALAPGFDRARDLDVTRDKFVGLPSKDARPIRMRLSVASS